MRRYASYAGVLAPPLLITVLATLTATERTFLRRIGWSPVRRTAVEWPSVLLLSHAGWIEAAAFVAAGVMTLALALAFYLDAPTGIAQLAGALVAIGGACLSLVAFKPDRAGESSWHGRLHNGAYDVLLLSALLASLLLTIGLRRADGWRRLANSSAITFAAVVLTVALTNVGAIAQLARYLLLSVLLVWLELIAVEVAARARR